MDNFEPNEQVNFMLGIEKDCDIYITRNVRFKKQDDRYIAGLERKVKGKWVKYRSWIKRPCEEPGERWIIKHNVKKCLFVRYYQVKE